MRTLLLIMLLPVMVYAELPNTIKDRQMEENFLELDMNKQSRLTAVNTIDDQTIAGEKTFSDTVTFTVKPSFSTSLDVSSITVSGMVGSSSATITNTLTANEVTTTYGFYHDRGNATGWDYNWGDGDFTENAWTDLDLSSIVPAGAKTVKLYVYIYDSAHFGTFFQFRGNGYANTYNIDGLRTQTANVPMEGSIEVPLDSGRVIEYFASTATWDNVYITVRGWYK